MGEEEDIMVREGREGARREGSQGEGLWQGKKKPDPWSCLHPNCPLTSISHSGKRGHLKMIDKDIVYRKRRGHIGALGELSL